MATHRLGVSEAATFLSRDLVSAQRRRVAGYWMASVVALAAYVGLLVWVLESSTGKVYGFPVSHDLPTLIEITLQVGPMIAAFFLVLLAPVKERIVASLAGRTRPARRVGTIVAVSAAAALVIMCASAVAILTVCEWRPGTLRALTSLWVAGELALDLTLIGVFTTALYALTRRLWATILIFFAYIAIVVTAGPAWGITSYIGFGSTVPVMITTYATAPLYDGAAWLLRGYWTCITLLMVSLLYAIRSTRPGIAFG